VISAHIAYASDIDVSVFLGKAQFGTKMLADEIAIQNRLAGTKAWQLIVSYGAFGKDQLPIDLQNLKSNWLLELSCSKLIPEKLPGFEDCAATNGHEAKIDGV